MPRPTSRNPLCQPVHPRPIRSSSGLFLKLMPRQTRATTPPYKAMNRTSKPLSVCGANCRRGPWMNHHVRGTRTYTSTNPVCHKGATRVGFSGIGTAAAVLKVQRMYQNSGSYAAPHCGPRIWPDYLVDHIRQAMRGGRGPVYEIAASRVLASRDPVVVLHLCKSNGALWRHPSL